MEQHWITTQLPSLTMVPQELARWRQEKAGEYVRMARGFAQVNSLYDERCAQVGHTLVRHVCTSLVSWYSWVRS